MSNEITALALFVVICSIFVVICSMFGTMLADGVKEMIRDVYLIIKKKIMDWRNKK